MQVKMPHLHLHLQMQVQLGPSLIFKHSVQTHRQRNNNPKPHISNREGIDSHCRRFASIFRRYDSICCRSCYRWRSIDRDRRIQQTLARDSVFAIAFVFFAHKKMLGRTETRTPERLYCQSIRTVRDISRDNRARIATCSLLTATTLRRIIV